MVDNSVMLSFQLLRVYAAAAALLAGICACTKPNPLVCCASRVDCQSIGADADQRTCASDLVCIDHMCVQPQCTIDTDCPTAMPFCAPDQTCVQCLQSDQCPATSPVCGSDGSCRACATDSECSSGVCDPGTGTCVAESTILYASPTGSDAASCTQQAPCSISRAFTVANIAQATIKLEPGTYGANITVNDRSLTVHGPHATVMSASTAGPTFTVNDRGHVTFFGLTIVNSMPGGNANSGIALDCESTDGVNSPSVSLDGVTLDADFEPVVASALCTASFTRSEFHNRNANSSTFVLVVANGATVTVDRSLLTGGDGVACLGKLVTITNSVIVDQTGPDGAFTGNGGAVHVSFSTIYNSHVRGLTGTASCSGNTLNGVCIDNSIINNVSAGAPSDTITGAACNVDHTLITPQATQRGTNNLFNMDPKFVSGATGDFHLQAGSPAIGAADPAAQDAVDYDGNPRAAQGSASDLGAFEYKP